MLHRIPRNAAGDQNGKGNRKAQRHCADCDEKHQKEHQKLGKQAVGILDREKTSDHNTQ